MSSAAGGMSEDGMTYGRFLKLLLALLILIVLPLYAEAQPAPSGPPAVGVVRAERQQITQTDEFIGRIQAVNRVSLSVERGEFFALLGPSGCGKTTLMRTIVGQQKITAGSATVFDQPAGARSLRRRIGYVTQSPSIYPDLTTVENLRYFARLYGVDKQRACEVIDAVGLTAKRSELAGNLSGGQQGRVSLACALVCDPDLLILDEPTVGVDIGAKTEIYRLIGELASQGAAILILSSDLLELLGLTDRILVFYRGKVVREFDASTANSDALLSAVTAVNDAKPDVNFDTNRRPG